MADIEGFFLGQYSFLQNTGMKRKTGGLRNLVSIFLKK
jgi:hypothetical protein